MKVNMTLCKAAPCSLDKFTINNIEADIYDFGELNKIREYDIDQYLCILLGFNSKPPNKKVLDKYNITVEEYFNIVDKLDTIFDVGGCNLCI